jgi:hypothetical protein
MLGLRRRKDRARELRGGGAREHPLDLAGGLGASQLDTIRKVFRRSGRGARVDFVLHAAPDSVGALE